MVARHNPAITVVIPTYNWSAALRCAIRSVLLQTMQDFEILVVGDGCTDDSERVVAEFNDPRICWHNLERNHGTQWAANNYANEHATGEWIAYLGHDDIWYPTHLAAIIRTAERESADIVTSTMILYWPDGTNGRGIGGLFATGAFGRGDFVPPSAFAHARSMYGSVVRWRDPATVAAPMDAVFLDDLAAARRKFASTHELTCFKFNAAWRRDAYHVKPLAEQERILERIESGVDFRQGELLDVLQSVVAGRFLTVVSPPTTGIKPGEYVQRSRRYKGLERRFPPDALQRIEKRIRFGMEQQDMPFEWDGLETNEHGTFRWTGVSRKATIDLPILFDRDLLIRINILAMLRPELADGLKLSVHGHPLDVRIDKHGSIVLEAEVRHAHVNEGRDFGVTIDTGGATRPCDVGVGDGTDRRWLGVAVNWIEVEPLG